MNLNYALDKDDYLQHQLFVATKAGKIKKQKIKTCLMVTGSMLVLSFLFYQDNDMVMAFYFLGFGLLTLLFYPRYQQNQYKKYYAEFIEENYRHRFGKAISVTFEEDVFATSDSSGDSRIFLTQIQSISDTPGHFYLKLKRGEYLIVAKSGIGDISRVRREFKKLSFKLGVSYVDELNWTWK